MSRLALLKSTKPPKSCGELHHRSDKDEWLQAHAKELTNLQEIDNMKIVSKPKNAQIIQLLELFVVKHNNLTQKTIPKVRFVARGDILKDSKAYFSAVASQVAVRIFVYLSLK